MLNALKRAVVAVGDRYINELNRRDQGRQVFREMNERPVEYSVALSWLNERSPVSVLDVGTGTTAWPALLRNCGFVVTAIDEVRSYWGSGGLTNRCFYVEDDDITQPQVRGPFDAITCISVLEHIPNADEAVEAMLGLLADDGRLILTFPFNEERYVPNAYELPGTDYGRGAPYICQVFNRDKLSEWPGQIAAQEYYRVFTGELWGLGERLERCERVDADETYQLSAIMMTKE